MSRSLWLPLALGAFGCMMQLGCKSRAPSSSGPATTDNGLRPAAAFASIADSDERARALFGEASRVLLHPRCTNCHPADQRPRQGNDSIMHVPPVWGGVDGRGVPALRCTSCHQDQNFRKLSMPGAPDWHLAPAEMNFLGRTAGQLCVGLKNNATNGGRTIEEVVHHVGHDKLVSWGFAPGPNRDAAPGSQATLAGLMRAWADAGAACPEENAR